MPHMIRIDQDRQLLVVSAYGTYTMHQVAAMLEEMMVHPQYTPGLAILADFRDAHFVLSGTAVQNLIESMSSAIHRHGGHRTAVVVDTDVMYGLSRMVGSYLEIMRAPTTFQIFTAHTEAEAWLVHPDA